MPEIFSRTPEEVADIILRAQLADEQKIEGLFRPGGDRVDDDAQQRTIVVKADGTTRIDGDTYNAQLLQSIDVSAKTCIASATVVFVGTTTIDLRAVLGRVKAALGIPPHGHLLVESVKIEATGGKDRLTVNGVEIPL